MACTVKPEARGHAACMGAAAVVLVIGLAACSSVTSLGNKVEDLGNKVEDSLPTSVGGLPSDIPARPTVQSDFVPVGDTPPRRDLKTLSEDERKKLESDLVTLRDRQEGKTSRPKEKPAPSSSASPKVTDQAANR